MYRFQTSPQRIPGKKLWGSLLLFLFLILLFTAFAGMNVTIANGNAKVINLASNVMSLFVFLLNGQVLFLLGLPAALCSIAGNYLGSTLVMKNGIRIVRPIIIVVLVILFIKIIMEMM